MTIFHQILENCVPQSYLQIAVLFWMNWFENLAAMPLKYATKDGNVGKKSNLYDVKVRYEIIELMISWYVFLHTI
jgi:hypothetical protein